MMLFEWMISCCFDVRIILSVLLLLLLFYLCVARKSQLPSVDPKGRGVFITGCDSGFGNLLARRLHSLGFTVFAACLFPDGEGSQALKDSSRGQIKVIKLDVTSDTEMAEAKQFVQDNLPENGLWGLVNNAGISKWGMSEWHSMDQYQKVMEINVLGSVRTTLAFAPLIRKSKGRIVFLSSVNAHIYSINSIYCMSKAGLEMFCDCFRLEMKRFGVLVSIIQPGNYAPATNIQPLRSADNVWNELSEEMQDIYNKEFVKKLTDFVNKELLKGSNKGHEVVDAIVDALASSKPKTRYLVANMMEMIGVILCSVCPTSLVDAILNNAMDL
ncbi:D-beta-hydroxybutyrate dehydrogenase, mitochondrial [Bombina bombina]|uniref:D-beta-hydroxybutyrate dehydrogenase, mitochondrial n=1 Tax=Bombina bombina TaxID=8345 RepID=UPI00235AEA9B|nr:D-beta-hydroxybutyrate dehydrogenase, mitochondrial [Bombina bombina]